MTDAGEAQRLIDLAEGIAKNTLRLCEKLKAAKIEAPSLAPESCTSDFLPPDETDLISLRQSIVDSSCVLADTLRGPKNLLLDHTLILPARLLAIRTVYEYAIPAHLPSTGSISYEDLAQKCGLAVKGLRRIVRFALHFHLFAEPQPGQVAHSGLSKYIANNPGAMAWIGAVMMEMSPAIDHQLAALKLSTELDDPMRCGWSVMSGRTFFDDIGSDPRRTERFASAMQWKGGLDGYHTMFDLLSAVDWESLGAAKLVDIGGSKGHNAAQVLARAPRMTAVVQDLPEVVGEMQREATSRMTFQAYNFLEKQPITDADVYLLSYILHDWPDETGRRILANTVGSMPRGSRLVVQEFVLLPYGECWVQSGRYAHALDLTMMSLLAGRERSLAEWQEMIREGSGAQLELEQHTQRLMVFKKL